MVVWDQVESDDSTTFLAGRGLWYRNVVFKKAVIFIMQADDLKTKQLNVNLKKRKENGKKVEVWGVYLNNTNFFF